MPRIPAHKPPQQARSRESLRRMLDATENVLEKCGAEKFVRQLEMVLNI